MELRRIVPVLAVGLFFAISPLFATGDVSVFLRKDVAKKGGVWQSDDGQFTWRITKDSLRNETRVLLDRVPDMGFDASSTLHPAERSLVLALNPVGYERISSVYRFELNNPAVYDRKKVSVLTINNSSDDGLRKRLFLFDTKTEKWNPLNPLEETVKGKVSAYAQVPSGMVALFRASPMTEGKASWYKYKGCDCAASPDFPKGTKLKVTNLANQKSVSITVNDWGPDRVIHPDRAIDLDVVAFKKIASTGAGIINVQIEVQP